MNQEQKKIKLHWLVTDWKEGHLALGPVTGLNTYCSVSNLDVKKAPLLVPECWHECGTGHQVPECMKARKGDVLVTTMGSKDRETGKFAVYVGDKPAIVGSHVAVLRVNCNPYWFAAMMNCKEQRVAIERLLQGEIFKHATMPMLRGLEVPVPPEREAQDVMGLKVLKVALAKIKCNESFRLCQEKYEALMRFFEEYGLITIDSAEEVNAEGLNLSNTALSEHETNKDTDEDNPGRNNANTEVSDGANPDAPIPGLEEMDEPFPESTE